MKHATIDKPIEAQPQGSQEAAIGFVSKNKRKLAALAFVAAGAATFATQIDHGATRSVEHAKVQTTPNNESSVEESETPNFADVTNFVDFRDTGATTSKVEVIGQDGTFVATATIAAEDYKDLPENAVVEQDGHKYQLAIGIDFASDKKIEMVNFNVDEHDYALTPNADMYRSDVGAIADGANHMHFQIPIYKKSDIFPDGKDMVITFEGNTAGDSVGAVIKPQLNEVIDGTS